MKKAILLHLIFLFSLSVFGKDNFKPGKIFSNKNDTISGYINFLNWKTNPSSIEFKKTLNSDTEVLMAKEIRGFIVENEKYLSGNVNTEVSDYMSTELPFGPEPNIKEEYLFLKVLVDGEKSLLYVYNSVANKNFYIKSEKGFELLIYKKYYKIVDNQKVSSENKKYIGQLIVYFQDAKNLTSQISKTPYKKEFLIKLFKNYYSAVGKKILYENADDKKPYTYGVIAGIQNASGSFNNGNSLQSNTQYYPANLPSELLILADFQPSISPVLGMFINYYIPSYQKKISLNNELIISGGNATGSTHWFYNDNFSKDYSIYIKDFRLKLNSSLRFSKQINNVSIFGEFGISNGVLSGSAQWSYVTITTYYNGSSSYNSFYMFENDGIRKLETGLLLGGGINYKKLFLEFRYERTNGILRYSNLGFTASNSYLILGFQF